MPNLVVMGNIHLVDDPECDGADPVPYEIKRALVIQFESREAIRAAIDAGKCEFTFMDRVAADLDQNC